MYTCSLTVTTFQFQSLIIIMYNHYISDAGVQRIMADLLPIVLPMRNEPPKTRAQINHNIPVIKYFIQMSSIRIDAESFIYQGDDALSTKPVMPIWAPLIPATRWTKLPILYP